MSLSEPSLDARLHQEKLLDYIRHAYHTRGKLSFADFMQMALYAPGLGYYSAGAQKFGSEGDFVTAPQISPLFSECVGRQCAQILSQLADASILELGAGDGTMACDIIHLLTSLDQLPQQYYILEVSGDLKARQQKLLLHRCPDFFDKIIWLNTLPETSFTGIILANEVLDAMPVHLFKIDNQQQVLEAQLVIQETWQCEFHPPISAQLSDAVKDIQQSLEEPMASGYISEINLNLAPFIASLASCLKQGVLLFIDYGFPEQEYYHPSRHMGTLMCHYRHHAHPDPLKWIGLQDITAHVNFSKVAKAATEAQLDVLGFTTQAAFLLANGLLTTPAVDSMQQLRFSQQIQQLVQPHEMGELFKVIALGKNYEDNLTGFQLRDFSHHL